MTPAKRNELAVILRQMRDFRPLKETSEIGGDIDNIVTRIYAPPAYLVKLLFFGILKFTDFGREDKVTWSTYFQYMGVCFKVRDFKFGTWTIEGDKSQPKSEELALQVRSKVEKACKKLDAALYPSLKGEMEKGNFFLYNEYSTLRNIYGFYKDKISNALKARERLGIERKSTDAGRAFPIQFGELLTKYARIELAISNYCFALILSFFSLQEFLFDVYFAFQNDGKGLVAFMKDDRWKEKFKAVISISENNVISKIYSRLLRIKEDYRNPLTHGLTSEPSILVSLPKLGLIPLSFEYLSRNPHYGIVPIGIDDAPEIVDAFESFLRYVSKRDPFRFYMKYVEYGFTIPATRAELEKIKRNMTDYKSFKQYIDERARFEDMVINREI